MAVFRVHKNTNYTVMSNTHLKDKNLSLKAKGLLSVMLSLPEDWDYSIPGLVAICSQEKEHAVKSGLNELKERGYLEIKKYHIDGRYQYEYNVFEQPRIQIQEQEIQGLENQPLEFQPLENHPLYKYTNKLNTNNKNTNKEYNNTQKQSLAKKPKRDVKELFSLVNTFCEQNNFQGCKQIFSDYIQNSLQLKKTLTVISLKGQLELLKSFNEKEIIDIVRKTMLRGWINVEYVINNEYRNKSFNDNMSKPNVTNFQKLSNEEF